MTAIQWQRSSRCGGGSCLEVAEVVGLIAIRRVVDGVQIGDPHYVTRAEWEAFVAGVEAGEFRFGGGHG